MAHRYEPSPWQASAPIRDTMQAAAVLQQALSAVMGPSGPGAWGGSSGGGMMNAGRMYGGRPGYAQEYRRGGPQDYRKRSAPWGAGGRGGKFGRRSPPRRRSPGRMQQGRRRSRSRDRRGGMRRPVGKGPQGEKKTYDPAEPTEGDESNCVIVDEVQQGEGEEGAAAGGGDGAAEGATANGEATKAENGEAKKERKPGYSWCTVCEDNFKGPFPTHRATLAHKQKRDAKYPRCKECTMTFKSPEAYKLHCDGKFHLKIVEHNNNKMEPGSEEPLGEEYVEETTGARCTLCDCFFQMEHKTEHCRSRGHVKKIKDKERAEREEAEREKRRQEREKRRQEEEEKKKQEGDEETEMVFLDEAGGENNDESQEATTLEENGEEECIEDEQGGEEEEHQGEEQQEGDEPQEEEPVDEAAAGDDGNAAVQEEQEDVEAVEEEQPAKEKTPEPVAEAPKPVRQQMARRGTPRGGFRGAGRGTPRGRGARR